MKSGDDLVVPNVARSSIWAARIEDLEAANLPLNELVEARLRALY